MKTAPKITSKDLPIWILLLVSAYLIRQLFTKANKDQSFNDLKEGKPLKGKQKCLS